MHFKVWSYKATYWRYGQHSCHHVTCAIKNSLSLNMNIQGTCFRVKFSSGIVFTISS